MVVVCFDIGGGSINKNYLVEEIKPCFFAMSSMNSTGTSPLRPNMRQTLRRGPVDSSACFSKYGFCTISGGGRETESSLS